MFDQDLFTLDLNAVHKMLNLYIILKNKKKIFHLLLSECVHLQGFWKCKLNMYIEGNSEMNVGIR